MSAGASGETSPKRGVGAAGSRGACGGLVSWSLHDRGGEPRSLSLPEPVAWDRSCTGQGGDERVKGK